MDSEHVIKSGEISLDLAKYMSTFRTYGKITFELTKEENEELLKMTSNFKDIEKQEHGFDMRSWLNTNMNFGLSEKAFLVFSFIITQWKPVTILNNFVHPMPVFIYFNVISGSSFR